MPKGTRVHRCVQALSDKHGYSGAIAICQKSTKQSYMTGKRRTRRKKRRRLYPIIFRGKKRSRRYKRGGRKISVLGNIREENSTASDAKRRRNQARRRLECDKVEAARRQRVCNSVRNKKSLARRLLFKCPTGIEILKNVVRERSNKETIGENVAWVDKCRGEGTLAGGHKRRTRARRGKRHKSRRRRKRHKSRRRR